MFKSLNILKKGFLIALLSLGASQALADPLAGSWQHNNQATSINIGPDFKLLFCNEQGDCADGYYRGKHIVYVPQWNVTGSVNRSRNLISWSNGTQWVRSAYDQPNQVVIEFGPGVRKVAGRWMHDGKPTSIRMQRDGIHFILINEYGQPSQGYMNGNHELVLPSINVSGRLRKHGRIITWTNGTTWYRP